MIDEPEATHIYAAQRGDRSAMQALLTPWNDPIFGFLLASLKNRPDAEDAAQETFLRIVKGLPGYEHRGDFKAWIYRIARNQAALTASRRRRLGERETGVDPEELNAFPDGQEEDDPDVLTRAATLRQAVAALPAAEREVVILRLEGDLKFREIAERTGAPLNTVLSRMRQAIARLRSSLITLLP